MIIFLQNVLAGFRIYDLIDITLVAVVIYRILMLLRDTHGIQIVAGFFCLGILYLFSNYFELYLVNLILRYFFDYLVIIAIVLFQDELRRALVYVGSNPFLLPKTEQAGQLLVEEIAKAATQMAREKVGALIVFERKTGLKNFIDTGIQLDAIVRSELLISTFHTSSPIHDGAVIIKDGRIAAAGCFLPLTKTPNIDKALGTRHRAAIGITEDSDAVVVLVSEEQNAAYLVNRGRVSARLTEAELSVSLLAILELTEYTRNTLPQKTMQS